MPSSPALRAQQEQARRQRDAGARASRTLQRREVRYQAYLAKRKAEGKKGGHPFFSSYAQEQAYYAPGGQYDQEQKKAKRQKKEKKYAIRYGARAVDHGTRKPAEYATRKPAEKVVEHVVKRAIHHFL